MSRPFSYHPSTLITPQFSRSQIAPQFLKTLKNALFSTFTPKILPLSMWDDFFVFIWVQLWSFHWKFQSIRPPTFWVPLLMCVLELIYIYNSHLVMVRLHNIINIWKYIYMVNKIRKRCSVLVVIFQWVWIPQNLLQISAASK